MKRLRALLPWFLGMLVVSSIFATMDGKEFSWRGWLAYFVLSGLCAGFLWIAWQWVEGSGSPRWLVIALVMALFLRLGIGLGLSHALPRYGYDEKIQQAGYVFYDAYIRDTESWMFATSDKPLISAFLEDYRGDQYGGVLFLSGMIYRVLSPDIHRPMLLVVFIASISSLAILFTWRFTETIFGSIAAGIATWTSVLYPDAILLGATQMREPFIILSLAIAFNVYAHLRNGRELMKLWPMILTAFIIPLLISPPFALAVLTIAVGAWIWEGRAKFVRSRWITFILAIFVIAAVGFMVRSWSTVGSLSGRGITVLLEWWKSASAQWQLNILADQSAWIRDLFNRSPEWAHFPLIVLYGLIRPFLPAALFDRDSIIWQSIAIWRGLGWFLLLPFLLYAPLAAIRKAGWRSLPTYLSFVVWITAILASYRGAGDQWDNPRYRAVFITLQAALVGWVWINSRKTETPWLRRTILLVSICMALFALWYGYRFQLRPYIGAMHVVIFIGAFIMLFLLVSVLKDVLRSRKVDA